MDAGLAGLVGAVIRSVGTGVTTGFTAWLASKQSNAQLRAQVNQLRMQLAAQHVQEQRDPRAQSYIRFVSEVRSQVTAMRHFTVDAIMDGIDFQDEGTIKEIANRYRNKFHELQPLYAAVAVHGPAIVSHIADEVMARVNAINADFLDYLAELHEGNTEGDRTFIAQCNKADQSVFKFLHTVRAALNDSGMMGSPDAAYYRAVSEIGNSRDSQHSDAEVNAPEDRSQ
ncbi:hypothetical protein ACFY9A_39890 [Streptomyces rubradiris]|uniref:hypothetical protein n=1 Tax=Streptomyces rubradiris TaxID=285531 RepID=UPI0036E5542B